MSGDGVYHTRFDGPAHPPRIVGGEHRDVIPVTTVLNLFISHDLSAAFDPWITGDLPAALDLWLIGSLSGDRSSHYAWSLTRTPSLCTLAEYDSRLSVLMKDDNSDYNITNQTIMTYKTDSNIKYLQINIYQNYGFIIKPHHWKIYQWLESAMHWLMHLSCLTLILCHMWFFS